MFELPRSVVLLRQVTARLWLAALGKRMYTAFLISCAVYAGLLVASRFGGLLTEWLTPQTLLAVPAVAALVALATLRRPTTLDAARAVDHQHGTKDLFLTVALIEKSAGEYQALVVRSAEERAAKLTAGSVAPFSYTRRLGRVGAVALAIAAAVAWLPQFDPFGKVEAAH